MGSPKQTNTGIVIQARMGAERLPGKILKPLAGAYPVLEWVVERSRRAVKAQEIIVATTLQPGDDIVETFCRDHEVRCFRGSEANVFERYYACAQKFQLDAVVRVTADCPFISPETIDRCIDVFWDSKADYVNNSRLRKTYPRGLDVEVVSFEALKRLADKALTPSEREHVTLYIYQHPEEFRIQTVEAEPALCAPELRLTLDTPDDFQLLNTVAEYFSKESFHAGSRQIVDYLRKHPDVADLNRHIEQKKIDGKII